MKKFALFFLVFCITHSICTHTMEQDDTASCSRLIVRGIRCFVSPWFSENKSWDILPNSKHIQLNVIFDSQRIQDIRDDMRKIEEKLKFSKKKDTDLTKQFENYACMNGLEPDFSHRYYEARLRPFLLQIAEKPKKILRYCYYKQYHTKEDEIAFEGLFLSMDPFLLAQCRKECIAGCSALGVALLANNVNSLTLCAFIQKLVRGGFKFTEKDKLFFGLYLWDSISVREKKVMTLVLQDHDDIGALSVLPYDVRKYIVHYMVCVSKKRELYFLNG